MAIVVPLNPTSEIGITNTSRGFVGEIDKEFTAMTFLGAVDLCMHENHNYFAALDMLHEAGGSQEGVDIMNVTDTYNSSKPSWVSAVKDYIVGSST